MPTWFLLVALVLFPVVVSLVCWWVGVDPFGTAGLAAVVSIGPFTVAIARAVAAAAPTPLSLPLAARVEWTVTMGPVLLAAATLAWGLHRGRHEAAEPLPSAWCARCDAALHTDHAGRYYSDADGYLCPPELRRVGGRRHQPGDRPGS